MNNMAFVFPGQGSQFVGMGKDLYNSNNRVKELYELADQKTLESISKISFDGPEDKLKQTFITQPAILTLSYSLYEQIKRQAPSIKPAFLAGHSLGEYVALVAAGVISFSDAVYLVYKRGKYMEQAFPSGSGSMAAVLGLDINIIQEICYKVSTKENVVEVANINCPGQIVISGHVKAISLFTELASELGARRVIKLAVSGPFHSSLMVNVANNIKTELNNINIKDADTPIIANVNAQPVLNAESIKDLLVKQVTSSVLWEDSVKYMMAQGIDTFVEVGPGQVLSGLVKKIDRKLKTYSINNQASINNFLQEVL